MVALPTTSQYRRQMAQSISSRASTPSFSDDEDAITPVVEIAAVPQPAPSVAAPERNLRSRKSSVASNGTDTSSVRSHIVDVGENIDTARLWQRMLAMQRKFRCYNSARITAALEDDSIGAVVPSRACLDLLNDSISIMPEEIRGQVADFIRNGDPGKRRKKRRVF